MYRELYLARMKKKTENVHPKLLKRFQLLWRLSIWGHVYEPSVLYIEACLVLTKGRIAPLAPKSFFFLCLDLPTFSFMRLRLPDL